MVVTRYLVEHPYQLIPLSWFADKLGVAKSSLSEDVGLIKRTLGETGNGFIETVSGAAGGVRYVPDLSGQGARELVLELAATWRKKTLSTGRFLVFDRLVVYPCSHGAGRPGICCPFPLPRARVGRDHGN